MGKRIDRPGVEAQAKRSDSKRSAEAKRATLARKAARRTKYGMGA